MKKNIKCLMLVTEEKRVSFTDQDNLPQIIEVCEALKIKIALVLAKEADVLDLKNLAEALSSETYTTSAEVEIIESISPKGQDGISAQEINQLPKPIQPTRKQIAQQIKTYICDRLISGHTVSLTELNAHFIKFNLTEACFSNHLGTIRRQLEKDGFCIMKMAKGEYLIDFAESCAFKKTGIGKYEMLIDCPENEEDQCKVSDDYEFDDEFFEGVEDISW